MGNWRNRGPVPPDTICVSRFSLFGMEHKRPSCSKRWVPTTKCMKAPNRTSSSPSGNALAAGAKDHGSSRAAVRTRGNGVRFRVKGASERLKEDRERAHRLTPNPKARPHPIYFNCPTRVACARRLWLNQPPCQCRPKRSRSSTFRICTPE